MKFWNYWCDLFKREFEYQTVVVDEEVVSKRDTSLFPEGIKGIFDISLLMYSDSDGYMMNTGQDIEMLYLTMPIGHVSLFVCKNLDGGL